MGCTWLALHQRFLALVAVNKGAKTELQSANVNTKDSGAS